MTTRSAAILSPNGKSSNETLNIYERELHIIVDNDEKNIIPKLREELKSGETSPEKFKVEIYKLKDKVSNLFKSIDDMKDLIKEQNKKNEDRVIQSTIENKELREDIEALEQNYKINLKETLNIKQKAHDNVFEIRGLQKTMEKYSLKLNDSNGQRGGAWALHSDVDMYPILKSDDKNYRYTKFQDNLKTIKLKGSKLMDIRDFGEQLM